MKEERTYRAVYVVVCHILRSTNRTLCVSERFDRRLIRRLKQNHVGLLVSNDVKALLVGACQQHIVAINELNKAAFSQGQSRVSGLP